MTAISTVIIPAYDEKANIVRTIQGLIELYGEKINVLVIVDNENDTTLTGFNEMKKPDSYKIVIQDYGPGPANAIKFGVDQSKTKCITVMMADGSDDMRAIAELSNLVDRGVAIACASRYMPGGQQVGGQRIKKFLSRAAGLSLYYFAGIGTHDPTNSFKSYSKEFLQHVKIDSKKGFEVGIELVAKAHRLRLPIAEIPTIWLDRTMGKSRFQIAKWIPSYFRWYLYCFGPKQNLSKR